MCVTVSLMPSHIVFLHVCIVCGFTLRIFLVHFFCSLLLREPHLTRPQPRFYSVLESTDSHMHLFTLTHGTYRVVMQVIGGPSTGNSVQQWSAQLRQAVGVACQVRVPSKGKVVIETDVSVLESVLDWLTDREDVTWAEERPAVAMLNKYAKCVVQNSTLDASYNFMWSKGLTGVGEVIGCADTGVDHDSCFFRCDVVTLHTYIFV
jgi:hypothetical protein